MALTHASDSTEQRIAEREIVRVLSADLEVVLGPGGRIVVGESAHVEIDARTADDSLLVEVYARQGTLHGGQLKKIGQDILKFALLRQQERFAESRMVIAFASTEAAASIRGWVAAAAAEFKVELRVAEIADDLRRLLVETQDRQIMENPDNRS